MFKGANESEVLQTMFMNAIECRNISGQHIRCGEKIIVKNNYNENILNYIQISRHIERIHHRKCGSRVDYMPPIDENVIKGQVQVLHLNIPIKKINMTSQNSPPISSRLRSQNKAISTSESSTTSSDSSEVSDSEDELTTKTQKFSSTYPVQPSQEAAANSIEPCVMIKTKKSIHDSAKRSPNLSNIISLRSIGTTVKSYSKIFSTRKRFNKCSGGSTLSESTNKSSIRSIQSKFSSIVLPNKRVFLSKWDKIPASNVNTHSALTQSDEREKPIAESIFVCQKRQKLNSKTAH